VVVLPEEVSRQRRCVMARKLERAEWRPFLDRVSKGLAGKQAEIKVASLDLGDQLQAGWVSLIGLVYDPKDDIVEVALEGLDHMIHKPRELYVEEEDGQLSSLEVVDADGGRQIIKLKDMLALPAA
jgi:Family of unknown function (DUF5335)